MWQVNQPLRLRGYVTAAILSLAALLLSLQLQPVMEPTPSALFYAAVAISASIGSPIPHQPTIR